VLLAVVLILAVVQAAGAQGLGGGGSTVGYIDNAIPGNYFRLRGDAVYDINRPDRAEFFYLRGADSKIDFQDVSTYLELALGKNFSGFVEIPMVFVNPTLDADANGVGDMNVGFKWAFLNEENQVATFQLRTWIPTGNPLRDLGNGHATIEPGFLLFERLTDRLIVEGEFKDWIPLVNDGFAGNILNYGVGASYAVYQSCQFRVAPVAEFVGWTVLSGSQTVVPPSGIPPAITPAENTEGFPIKGAAGDTIVNVKVGVRVNVGDWGSVYAGYGRALTGDFWYKNVYRLEFRLAF
jgi:hypothetical protein